MTTPWLESLQGANLSDCRKYRYTLWRSIYLPLNGQPSRMINFICLNPSTADANKNDPTVKRLIARALMLGFHSLVVTNLFAWRATDPTELRQAKDPVGPENDAVLLATARNSDLVVCAWGGNGKLFDRDVQVTRMLQRAGIALHALQISEVTLTPAHPLYLPYTLKPVAWNPFPEKPVGVGDAQ